MITKESARFLAQDEIAVIDYPELGFTVQAERTFSHAIQYRIFKRFGQDEAFYESQSGEHVPGLEHEEEWRKPVPFMTGFVKWDGCSEWDGIHYQFNHFCDDISLLNVGKILHECWHLTAKLLEKWDY